MKKNYSVLKREITYRQKDAFLKKKRKTFKTGNISIELFPFDVYPFSLTVEINEPLRLLHKQLLVHSCIYLILLFYFHLDVINFTLYKLIVKSLYR